VLSPVPFCAQQFRVSTSLEVASSLFPHLMWCQSHDAASVPKTCVAPLFSASRTRIRLPPRPWPSLLRFLLSLVASLVSLYSLSHSSSSFPPMFSSFQTGCRFFFRKTFRLPFPISRKRSRPGTMESDRLTLRGERAKPPLSPFSRTEVADHLFPHWSRRPIGRPGLGSRGRCNPRVCSTQEPTFRVQLIYTAIALPRAEIRGLVWLPPLAPIGHPEPIYSPPPSVRCSSIGHASRSLPSSGRAGPMKYPFWPNIVLLGPFCPPGEPLGGPAPGFLEIFSPSRRSTSFFPQRDLNTAFPQPRLFCSLRRLLGYNIMAIPFLFLPPQGTPGNRFHPPP